MEESIEEEEQEDDTYDDFRSFDILLAKKKTRLYFLYSKVSCPYWTIFS